VDWLNYQHLCYFWTAVRQGSIAAACKELRLAPSTVSAQIHRLEERLGQKLMRRTGKTLGPTEAGTFVFAYASAIFSLGDEMLVALRDRDHRTPRSVHVGVVHALPRILAHCLIAPALRLREKTRVVCRQGHGDELLRQLEQAELDMVLSDASAPPNTKAHFQSSILGDSGVIFLASRKLAAVYRKNFPWSLDGAPLLLPTDHASLRLRLDTWLESNSLRPVVVGEFEDHAMLRTFAETGEGIVPVPSIVGRQFCRDGRLRKVGTADDVRIQFYGITTENKLSDALVLAFYDRPRLASQTPNTDRARTNEHTLHFGAVSSKLKRIARATEI